MKVSTKPIENAEVILKELVKIEAASITGLNVAINTETQKLDDCCFQITAGDKIGFAWPMFRSKDLKVDITRSFFPKGAFVDFHEHPAIEVLVLWEGKMKIIRESDRKETVLETGDVIRFKRGESHSALCEENTWLVAISIPAIDLDSFK